MITINSFEFSSIESEGFMWSSRLEKGSPARTNTLAVLNSMQLSGAMAREIITFSTVASPKPQIVTIESDSIQPKIPYGFGNQHTIVPPSLNDLNLPPNPFNVLNTKVVLQPNEQYSPQSSEPLNPAPISTPPMILSAIGGWKTPHTITNDATFYSEDDTRRVYWDISSSDSFDSNEPRPVSITSRPSSTPQPPRRQKRKLSKRMGFPKKRGVSQHTIEAGGQPLPTRKTPWCSDWLKNYIATRLLSVCSVTVSSQSGSVYYDGPGIWGSFTWGLKCK